MRKPISLLIILLTIKKNVLFFLAKNKEKFVVKIHKNEIKKTSYNICYGTFLYFFVYKIIFIIYFYNIL